MQSKLIANIAVSFGMFVIAAVYIKGTGPDALIVALLSVATFLFGILGAYILQNRQTRLDNLRMVLRQDDSSYINIYKMSAIFGKKVQKKVQNLIISYIDSTIDYELKDFHMSSRKFLDIYDFVLSLQKNKMSPVELNALDNMIDCVSDANKNRKYTEYLTRDKMLGFEWFILIMLYLVILVCVFSINDNSITSIGITILISTVSMTLILVIRDLDNLLWKEDKWTWDPLTQLYIELDTLPYMPADIVRSGRGSLQKGKRYRLASYPFPYPDMRNKKIEIRAG